MRICTLILTALCVTFSLSAQSYLYASPGGSGDGLTTSTPIDLQGALDLAPTHTSSNLIVIRMMEGTYDQTPYTYDFLGTDGRSVYLIGSYSADFSSSSEDPESTIVTGNLTNRVFHISGIDANITAGVFELRHMTVQDGRVTGENGAGVLVECGEGDADDSDIRLGLDNVILKENETMFSGSGAALYTDGYLNISDCLFTDNTSASNGGAIMATYRSSNADLQRQILRTTFRNNINNGNQGSSVWLNVPTMSFTLCDFYGVDGGGNSGNGSTIWIQGGGKTRILRCEFRDITINHWGSAVQAWDSDVEITNSLFVNNKCGILSGTGTVAYYHNNSITDRELLIANCTFAENEGSGTGDFASAIHFRGNGADSIKVYNSIFWDNGLDPIYKQTGTAEMAYSITEYNPSGFSMEQVLNDDPMLDGNYYAGPMSDARDGGKNEYLPFAEDDLDGNIRILNNTIDMGCFEYNRAPWGIIVVTPYVEENFDPNTDISLFEISDEPGDNHSIDFATGDGTNDADNGSFYIQSNKLWFSDVADFETQNSYRILLRVTDSGGGEHEEALVINILDVNDAPTFSGTIPDQVMVANQQGSFTLTGSQFNDVDDGDVLTFTSFLADESPLPVWLNFDAGTLTYSGTPPEVNNWEIELTATDQSAFSVSGTFTLSSTATGLEDFENKPFKLYPNPVADHLLLDMKEGGSWKMTIADADGRIIQNGGISNGQTRLNTEAMSDGVYFIRLFNNKSQFIVPFIKL